MRRDADFFQEDDLDLLFVARRLREALKIERILSDAGIDFLVETATYIGGFLLKRELTGAFFYVPPSDLENARQLLLANNFPPYRAEAG
jgi:hypothetical protein